MSIILFFLVLFVLILVHEWGHFIVAKKTGMRVDEFGIGFPPKAWGFRSKGSETEYTLNWLPIGGFVRIYGENPDDEIDGDPIETSRAFSERPKWAQALVLIAGVTMNVLFAWLLFSITFMIGVPAAVDESSATANAELYVASVLEGSPAEGQIPPGSRIVDLSAAGSPSVAELSPSGFSQFVIDTAPEPVTVQYYLPGDDPALVDPSVIELTPQQGLLEDSPERYLIGTSLALVETKKSPVHLAFADGFMATINGLVSITVGLTTLIVQSFSGTADYSQIAGPVGIIDLVGDAASIGITALLTFTAIISLNLAVINLLPFPALDGGRLVFVAIEAVTRRKIPPAWAARVNFAGFALLMLLMVAVTYNDILRLL